MSEQHESTHHDVTPAISPVVATPEASGTTSMTPSLSRPLLRKKIAARLHRRESGSDGVMPGADQAVAAASSSSGAPLPGNLQTQFGNSLGADLSGVRVHTGAASEKAAESVGAKAYTMGNDIHFGAGQFDASSKSGQHLLAHEVAHTQQQASGGGGGGTQFKLEVSQSGDSSEHEADRAADAMVSGAPAGMLGSAGAIAQRKEEAGSAYDQLKKASDGNWIGNVDEDNCLRLINQLSGPEKIKVKEDQPLMRKLCGAFNASEILKAVNALDFDLAWKIYWCRIAKEVSSIKTADWVAMFAAASVGQIKQVLDSTGMLAENLEDMHTSPLALFGKVLNTPMWGQGLAKNKSLVQWIIKHTEPTLAIQSLGGKDIADGDLAGINGQILLVGWQQLLNGIGKGSGMSPPARTALFRFAGVMENLPWMKSFFEQRFGKKLPGRTEETVGKNAGNEVAKGAPHSKDIDWKVSDIRLVWKQLNSLPDSDVADNSVLKAFQAISGDRGFWAGGDRGIQIGDTMSASADPDRLGHTVRHEVGHATHELLAGVVNPWLQNAIGFWYMDQNDPGVRQLIAALGGFPATWKDSAGVDKPFAKAQQDAVVAKLVAHTGTDAGFAATGPAIPATGAAPADDTDRYWAAMNAKVHTCFEQSNPNWWTKHGAMPSGARGKYFWNHWYKRPFYYGTLAESITTQIADTYTLMSEKEMFANCYAAYFKDEAGYNDHSKWGVGLPAEVTTFFTANILNRQPYTPPPLPGGAVNTAPPPPPAGGGGGVPKP